MAKTNDKLTIDVHGLTSEEAKKKVEKAIASSPTSIKQLIVIHGYNRGNRLQETIRTKIRSQRIREISPHFTNEGITTIYLK